MLYVINAIVVICMAIAIGRQIKERSTTSVVIELLIVALNFYSMYTLAYDHAKHVRKKEDIERFLQAHNRLMWVNGKPKLVFQTMDEFYKWVDDGMKGLS